MMKLKYSICCGLDVHKNVIVATIVTTNKDGISEYLQKSFSTINSDIQRFHNWLIENNCYHVCMESTGKYWILGPLCCKSLHVSFRMSLTRSPHMQLNRKACFTIPCRHGVFINSFNSSIVRYSRRLGSCLTLSAKSNSFVGLIVIIPSL